MLRSACLTVLIACTLIALPASAQRAPIDDDAPATPPAAPPQPPPPQYQQQQPPQYQQPPQQYQQPQPGYYPPQGYYAPPPPPPKHPEQQRRWGLLTAGIGIFGGLYILTNMGGYLTGNSGTLIPVVGPLLYINTTPCVESQFNFCSSTYDSDQRFSNLFLVLDAIGQAAGIAMAIAGYTTTHQVMVAITPTINPNGGYGFSAVGRF